jgi:hypothetical protein
MAFSFCHWVGATAPTVLHQANAPLGRSRPSRRRRGTDGRSGRDFARRQQAYGTEPFYVPDRSVSLRDHASRPIWNATKSATPVTFVDDEVVTRRANYQWRSPELIVASLGRWSHGIPGGMAAAPLPGMRAWRRRPEDVARLIQFDWNSRALALRLHNRVAWGHVREFGIGWPAAACVTHAGTRARGAVARPRRP